MHLKKIKNLLPVLLLTFSLAASAQDKPVVTAININDSLSLSEVLRQVVTTYPSVLKAQEAINSADAMIGLAKSTWYPNIDAGAGFTRIGPVSEITLPTGTFDIMPNNNYNLTGSITQTIYDFSKTARNIRYEEANKTLAETNVDLVKQRLTLLTAISYYTLVYLQEAIRIKDVQINTLRQHLDFVTTKMQTGSSTQYEVLSTQVRISNSENQKVDLTTSMETQFAVLNSLMGLPVSTVIKVQHTLGYKRPDVPEDSLISFALSHRYELGMAKLKVNRAELHLKSVKAMNFPVLSANVTGGFKNGYIPDMNEFTPNYTAGVGIRWPVFDATRRKNNIRLVNSEISMSNQEIDQVTRDISTEVYQNEAGLQASIKKIEQGRLQVQQADAALDLAKISFSTGAITNLDLLDAESAEAESQLVLKARIDYAINVVRLNISLGYPMF